MGNNHYESDTITNMHYFPCLYSFYKKSAQRAQDKISVPTPVPSPDPMWDLPCVQLISYLEVTSTLNLNSDDDDDILLRCWEDVHLFIRPEDQLV